jgi:2-desacetyl-2-hydroxyethyl bacteriochlorophyllide A dehydrogenase
MRAVVKHTAGPGGIDLLDVAEPEVRTGTAKVRVAAVGVCGTDRLALEGAYEYPVPLILGHEVSGVVSEVGPGVEAVRVGDRVTMETDAYIDGTCRWCRVEKYNNCPNRKAIGTSADGGLADAIVIRAGALHRLPEGMSLAAGALVEPLAIATHAVLERAADVGVGTTAVVYGPGAIGLLMAQTAKAAGARVVLVALERHAGRLTLGRRLGVDAAVASEREDVARAVAEVSGGTSADIVFECSGASDVVPEALKLLRKEGELVLVAFFGSPPELDAEVVTKKELRVLGSRGKGPSSYRRALRLLEDDRVHLEAVVTHRLPLERWREGFDLLGAGRKVLFEGRRRAGRAARWPVLRRVEVQDVAGVVAVAEDDAGAAVERLAHPVDLLGGGRGEDVSDDRPIGQAGPTTPQNAG